MKPPTFMLIAGEVSGDLLAAELVRALRREWFESGPPPEESVQPLHATLAPRFFGAGGSRMAEAGVDLAFDLTQHSVIGLVEVLKRYRQFKRLFDQLVRLACERQPDVIVCVDFSGFNRRFAHAIKAVVRSRAGVFHNWKPKIVQYVSPQVWASRPGRAWAMARDFDLVLSIFPFEKEWYAGRVPHLPVEFVGHPMLDRHAEPEEGSGLKSGKREQRPDGGTSSRSEPKILLLPGSRTAELKRHLPVMLGALAIIRKSYPALRARLVSTSAGLAELAQRIATEAGSVRLVRRLGNDATSLGTREVELQVGGLTEALTQATLAIASTGTVTMECAFFKVPTVALYKTSWSTYQIGKRIVKVQHLAMPNIIAGERIFPEFVQHEATPENLARASLSLLNDPSRQAKVKEELARVIRSLGSPGASRRAAQAIVRLLRAGT